jgi:hypothetical protein
MKSPRQHSSGIINRDAARDAPALFNDRLPRKTASRQITQAPTGKKKQAFIAGIYKATAAEWCEQLLEDDSKAWLVDRAKRLTSTEWFRACRERFTAFSIGMLTQEGFKGAAAQEDTGAMELLVRQWLHTRLVQMQQPAWKEGLGCGVIPLWSPLHGGASSSTPPRFDCMVVEPFNPDWDPSFLMDYSGSLRIAEAVTALHADLSEFESTRFNALLSELCDLNDDLQGHLAKAHQQATSDVTTWLKRILEPNLSTLHSVEPFGSSILGCATEQSDVDLMAFVHSSLPPHSLVRVSTEAMEASPPAWLVPGSPNEVLQTSKCPVLTFEYKLADADVVCIEQKSRARTRELCKELGMVLKHDEAGAFTVRSLSIDVVFNSPLTMQENRILKETFRTKSARRLLVWLKHWTKSGGINEPKAGTLSSFGWRLILMSVLIESGSVPCLRDGFQESCNIGECISGVNVWFARREQAAAEEPLEEDEFCLIAHFAAELVKCVGADSMRVFQCVTSTAQRTMDCTWKAMAQSEEVSPSIEAALQMFPQGCTRLLICDVDGCIFNITPELLAQDLEGDAFFFNSKESIPAVVAEHTFDFLAAASARGFAIAIVSGRDEGILPHVKRVVEQRHGPNARTIRPFCYLFKSLGSHVPTVEHKKRAIHGLLAQCEKSGIDIQTVGLIDDMDAHMSAFVEGARPFQKPLFSLTAVSTPTLGIRLRPYSDSTRDIVILALPSGSRKAAILHRVNEQLGSSGVQSRVVEWRSGGAEQWPLFVKEIVSCLVVPSIRLILVKIVPDIEKVKKLSLFLGGEGRVVCFHEPSGATASTALTQGKRLAQLSRVLRTNEARSDRPGQGQHVKVPEGLTLWPRDDSSYQRWAEEVWSRENGVSRLYTHLGKKARKAAQLMEKQSDAPRLEGVAFEFYEKNSPAGDLAMVGGSASSILDAQKSAGKKRREVLKLMGALALECDDDQGFCSIERDLSTVVDEISAHLVAWVAARGSTSEDGHQGALEAALRPFVDIGSPEPGAGK